MSECDGTGDPQVHVWDSSELDDSYSYSGSGCTYTDTYAFELAAAVESDRNLNSDGNPELVSGATFWLGSFFTDLPEGFIDSSCRSASTDPCFYNDCSQEQVKVTDVEYDIRHSDYFEDDGTTSGYTNDDYRFINPVEPKSLDDDSSSDLLPTLFNLGTVVSKSTIAGIGLTIVQFLSDQAADPVNYSGVVPQSESDYNFNQYYQNWHMLTDDQEYSDLPDGPCSSTGVKFTIDNQRDSTGDKQMTTWNRYTFRYRAPSNSDCQCEGAFTSFYDLTTPMNYNLLTFEGK